MVGPSLASEQRPIRHHRRKWHTQHLQIVRILPDVQLTQVFESLAVLTVFMLWLSFPRMYSILPLPLLLLGAVSVIRTTLCVALPM